MSDTIRSLKVMIGVDLSAAQKGFAQAAKDLKKAGKDMVKTGEGLTKGLTLPIIGAAAGLAAMTVKSAESAKALSTLSKQTSVSTDTLQMWDYAGKEIGFTMEDMSKGLVKITKAVGIATKAHQDFINIAPGVSVSLKDANGNMLSTEEVLYKVIDALGSMTDETARDTATYDIFAKKFQDMKPLIGTGTDELKRLGQQAKDTGAIISSSSIDSLSKFNDEIDQFKAVLKAATAGVAVEFAPVLESLQPILMTTIVPALKGLADVVKSVFDWFNQLSPTAQKIIMLFTGLAIAIGPLLTITGKMTIAISGLVKGIGAAIKSISAGGGLSGAMSALMGPAGLVTVAIVALVAIIGTLAIVASESETATSKLKKKIDDLNKTIADSKKTFDENVDSININNAAATKLSDELYDLATRGNKSNVEIQRMKQLVDQLNKIYPNLGLTINETTGALNKEKKSIQDVTEAMKQQAITSAYSDRYTQLIKEQIQIKLDLADANLAVADAQKDLNDRANDTNLHYMGGGGVIGFTQVLADAKSRVDGLNASLQANSLEQQKITTMMNDSSAAIVNANQDIAGSNQAVIISTQEQMDKLEDAYSKNIEAMKGMSGELIKQTNLTANQIEKAWNKNTKTFNTFESGLDSLKKKFPQLPADLEAQLKKMGPENLRLISDLNKKTPKELEKWIAAWQGQSKAAMSAAVGEVTDTKQLDAMGAAGNNLGKVFGDGITSSTPFIKSAATEAVNIAINAMRKAAGLGPVNLGPVSGYAPGYRYHAAGFVTNKPIAFGMDVMGEKGGEALLPLESNTGWMDKIADKVMARIGSLNANIDVNIPLIVDGDVLASVQTKQKKNINLQYGV